MAGKKRKTTNEWEVERDAAIDSGPIDGNKFFGFVLDEYQQNFIDNFMNPEVNIIFCDAVAGSGKTTLAAACGEYSYQKNWTDGIIYITAPVQEQNIGYLPGSIQEKTDIYAEPFIEALETIGVDTYRALKSDDLENKKFDPLKGYNYIDIRPHNYLRGVNFDKKVVIIDEAQNFKFSELKKVMTRCHDTCKLIVIGHSMQCDLRGQHESGFIPYIKAAEQAGLDNIKVCRLVNNYRGFISRWADSISKLDLLPQSSTTINVLD